MITINGTWINRVPLKVDFKEVIGYVDLYMQDDGSMKGIAKIEDKKRFNQFKERLENGYHIGLTPEIEPDENTDQEDEMIRQMHTQILNEPGDMPPPTEGYYMPRLMHTKILRGLGVFINHWSIAELRYGLYPCEDE